MALSLSVEILEVERIASTPKFDLPRSRIFPWLTRISLDSRELLEEIKSRVPTTHPDVVDWMQEAASWNAVLDLASYQIKAAGGMFDYNSNDPYIPGCRVGDLRFNSQPRASVMSQTYSILITPVGNFNVPNNDKLTIAQGDLLAWAATRVPSTGGVQWTGALAQWRTPPSTPMTQTISCVNLNGLTSPQFVSVMPPLGLKHVDYITISSNKPQSILLRLRSPTNYGNVLGEVKANIGGGQSTLRLRVFGVGSYLTEIQPENNTNTSINQYISRRF